jgi:hypothetical protein
VAQGSVSPAWFIFDANGHEIERYPLPQIELLADADVVELCHAQAPAEAVIQIVVRVSESGLRLLAWDVEGNHALYEQSGDRFKGRVIEAFESSDEGDELLAALGAEEVSEEQQQEAMEALNSIAQAALERSEDTMLIGPGEAATHAPVPEPSPPEIGFENYVGQLYDALWDQPAVTCAARFVHGGETFVLAVHQGEQLTAGALLQLTEGGEVLAEPRELDLDALLSG